MIRRAMDTTAIQPAPDVHLVLYICLCHHCDYRYEQLNALDSLPREVADLSGDALHEAIKKHVFECTDLALAAHKLTHLRDEQIH